MITIVVIVIALIIAYGIYSNSKSSLDLETSLETSLKKPVDKPADKDKPDKDKQTTSPPQVPVENPVDIPADKDKPDKDKQTTFPPQVPVENPVDIPPAGQTKPPSEESGPGTRIEIQEQADGNPADDDADSSIKADDSADKENGEEDNPGNDESGDGTSEAPAGQTKSLKRKRKRIDAKDADDHDDVGTSEAPAEEAAVEPATAANDVTAADEKPQEQAGEATSNQNNSGEPAATAVEDKPPQWQSILILPKEKMDEREKDGLTSSTDYGYEYAGYEYKGPFKFGRDVEHEVKKVIQNANANKKSVNIYVTTSNDVMKDVIESYPNTDMDMVKIIDLKSYVNKESGGETNDSQSGGQRFSQSNFNPSQQSKAMGLRQGTTNAIQKDLNTDKSPVKERPRKRVLFETAIKNLPRKYEIEAATKDFDFKKVHSILDDLSRKGIQVDDVKKLLPNVDKANQIKYNIESIRKEFDKGVADTNKDAFDKTLNKLRNNLYWGANSRASSLIDEFNVNYTPTKDYSKIRLNDYLIEVVRHSDIKEMVKALSQKLDYENFDYDEATKKKFTSLTKMTKADFMKYDSDSDSLKKQVVQYDLNHIVKNFDASNLRVIEKQFDTVFTKTKLIVDCREKDAALLEYINKLKLFDNYLTSIVSGISSGGAPAEECRNDVQQRVTRAMAATSQLTDEAVQKINVDFENKLNGVEQKVKRIKGEKNEEEQTFHTRIKALRLAVAGAKSNGRPVPDDAVKHLEKLKNLVDAAEAKRVKDAERKAADESENDTNSESSFRSVDEPEAEADEAAAQQAEEEAKRAEEEAKNAAAKAKADEEAKKAAAKAKADEEAEKAAAKAKADEEEARQAAAEEEIFSEQGKLKVKIKELLPKVQQDEFQEKLRNESKKFEIRPESLPELRNVFKEILSEVELKAAELDVKNLFESKRVEPHAQMNVLITDTTHLKSEEAIKKLLRLAECAAKEPDFHIKEFNNCPIIHPISGGSKVRNMNVNVQLSPKTIGLIENMGFYNMVKLFRWKHYTTSLDENLEIVVFKDYLATLILCTFLYAAKQDKLALGTLSDQIISMLLYSKYGNDKLLLLPYYLPCL